MAIQGSLKTIKIPELFSLLHQLRKTGILTLVSERDERGFLFYRGNLIYGTTKDGSLQLGTILVRLGMLTSEDLSRELGKSSSAEVYFGQRLVESGQISQGDLNAAVQEQIMDLTEDVLTWTSGAFHFEDNELPFAIPDGRPVSTHSIILEATRRSDEREHVRRSFPDLNVVLARAEEIATSSSSAQEERVLALADGRRTIEQILFTSPLREQETAQILHQLVEANVLRQVGVQVQSGLSRPVPELYCLPVAPDVPGKLFSVFNADDYQIPKIAQLVSLDPMLTAKVLKALTLGDADLPRGSLDVRELVDRLGTFRLRSILVPEAIRGLFFSRPESFWKECWEHSILCADISRRVATWVEYPHPEEAYLAGLLHNLGAFILMHHDPAAYRKVVTRSIEKREDIEVLEEEAFGISHTKLGGTYAEKWKFPKTIVLSIRGHHNVDSSNQHPILNIVSASNGIADSQGISVGYLPSAKSQFRYALKRLRLQRRKVMTLVNQTSRRIALAPA